MSTVGRFEATCHACGYTEFYARDFAQVFAHLASNPASGVRFVDTSVPAQGPPVERIGVTEPPNKGDPRPRSVNPFGFSTCVGAYGSHIHRRIPVTA
jgi:hypothetical protein